MKTRHILLLTIGAVPLTSGLAHAQPRLKDRVNTGAPVAQVGAAAPATPPTPAPAAPAPAPAPSPGTATPAPGTTGGVPAAGALGKGPQAPGTKAPSDTTSLGQFENALEFEPRSPNYRVAFSLEDA